MSKKLLLATIFAFVGSFIFIGQGSAHVEVSPEEVQTATFQTFSVIVPNEKEVAVTEVKLQIPNGLQYVVPTSKPGWTITTVKDGIGGAAIVKSITWKGTMPVGFRDVFTFSAKVPDQTASLEWKAYQTYADGVTVNWDQPASEHENDDEMSTSGPFSVTKVVTQSSQDAATENVKARAVNAKRTADRAMIVGASGVVLGLVALFVATKKRR